MALPSSGSLSLKSAAGAGRSISQEVDGNETGSKSLTTLSVTAGKSSPHSMLEFYGYSPCIGPPNSVTSTHASVVSDDVTVTWTPDTFGETATQFSVERNAQSSPGTWVLVAIVPAGAGNSCADNNLASDRYTYRISAQNDCGNASSVTTNSVIVP